MPERSLDTILFLCVANVLGHGVGSFLHASRTDLAMLCGATFLAIVGADRWSLDRLLARDAAGSVDP